MSTSLAPRTARAMCSHRSFLASSGPAVPSPSSRRGRREIHATGIEGAELTDTLRRQSLDATRNDGAIFARAASKERGHQSTDHGGRGGVFLGTGEEGGYGAGSARSADEARRRRRANSLRLVLGAVDERGEQRSTPPRRALCSPRRWRARGARTPEAWAIAPVDRAYTWRRRATRARRSPQRPAVLSTSASSSSSPPPPPKLARRSASRASRRRRRRRRRHRGGAEASPPPRAGDASEMVRRVFGGCLTTRSHAASASRRSRDEGRSNALARCAITLGANWAGAGR